MGKYAGNTTVSPEKSQAEIQTILRRYGADQFGVIENSKLREASVVFEYNGILIKLTVGLPSRSEFETTDTGRERTEQAIETALNQAIKQRWRALLLAIKAKLEAIECGISTVEQEFMAFMIMPDGRSLGDHVIPKLAEVVKSGKMPVLLEFNQGVK